MKEAFHYALRKPIWHNMKAKQNPHNANLTVVIPEVAFAYIMSAGNVYLSACHGSYKVNTEI